MANYWSGILRDRLTRRRAVKLTGAGLALAGSLSVVGCGDDDSDSDSEPSQPSALPKPVDSTSSAVRGGNFMDRIANDASWYTYDQNLNSNGNDGIAGWVYSHLVQLNTGTREDMPDGSVKADFAEKYEYSPDGLTVTFKIRPGMKWDARPPTSGRIADSSDAMYSYQRWAAASPRRSFLENKLNPTSPVTSISAPDASTFVMKLAFPFSPLMGLLSGGPYPLMMPKETEEFDPRNTSRGTGPWMLDEHRPSAFVRMKRNPDYYAKDRPLLDTWTLNVVPDYAAALAQFKTGALDSHVVNQEDILITKQDVSSLVIGQRPTWLNNPNAWILFSTRQGSPYRDERVRQALSMDMDRDAFLDAYSGRQKFEAAGLPVETAPGTFIGSAHPFWLDPRKNELGDASKYFTFNPAEAKKLLSAAGFNTTLEAPWSVPDINQNERVEAVRGGISTVGHFKLEPVNVMTYVPDYSTKVRDSHGDFDGVAWTGVGNLVEIDQLLFSVFHPSSDGCYYLGLGEDKTLTSLVEKQRGELDAGKRGDIIKDLQRHAASKMYMVPSPGDFKTFYLYQPWLMNFDYQVTWAPGIGNAQDATSLYTSRWIDASKRKS